MPAPLVAAAAAKPAGEAVGKAAEQITKALTTDLYVVRRVRQTGTKKEPVLEETQLHVNALGILIVGAVGLGAAAVGAILSATARDRTIGKGQFNPITLTVPGWYDNFNRTAIENGWTREPGQLFYHRPKKED